MRALIGNVTRVEIADGLRCAIDGDTVRVTLAPAPDGALSPDAIAATGRAAGLAAQLGTAERAEVTRERDEARRERDGHSVRIANVGAVELDRDHARRERDAWSQRYGALAEIVCGIAAGREPTTPQPFPGAEVGRALAALARRVDPQPAGGAVGVGAGVDLAALVAAFAERIETRVAGVVGRKLAAEFRIAADRLARQPDRGADEGHEPSERGAEVVRVVVGEGPLATAAGRGPLYVGQRIGVYGGDLDGLAGREGQNARLIVEVVGHSASIAPAASERESRGEVPQPAGGAR